MITMDVAPGVHRVSAASTNLYLLEDEERVTLIDGGLPGMWDETTAALRAAGRGWPDVSGRTDGRRNPGAHRRPLRPVYPVS